MVIQVFINFYVEINIVMLFLKTASKYFMPGNLGVLLSPCNDCGTWVWHSDFIFTWTPNWLFTVDLDDEWTFPTDAKSDSTGKYTVYLLKSVSVNFDLHMDASQDTHESNAWINFFGQELGAHIWLKCSHV